MNVTCPNCATVYRVDPAKVPEGGVRARCSICSAVFAVGREGEPSRAAPAGGGRGGRAAAPAPPRRRRPAAAPPPPAAAAPAALGPGGPLHRRPRRPRRRPGARQPPRPPRRPAAAPAALPRSAATGRPAAAAPGRRPPRAGSAAPALPRPAPAGRAGGAAPPAPPPPPPSPAAAPARAAQARGRPGSRPVNPFLSQDPALKARRLARALISDMVVYHPAKRQEGLRDGNLKELFEEEIRKSWEEYAEQVGKDVADSTPVLQGSAERDPRRRSADLLAESR